MSQGFDKCSDAVGHLIMTEDGAITNVRLVILMFGLTFVVYIILLTILIQVIGCCHSCTLLYCYTAVS